MTLQVCKFDEADADCALATNASMVLDRLISLGRAFQFQIMAGKFLGLDKDAINLLDFTVQIRLRTAQSKSCLNHKLTTKPKSQRPHTRESSKQKFKSRMG
jgi:hypothetical protein